MKSLGICIGVSLMCVSTYAAPTKRIDRAAKPTASAKLAPYYHTHSIAQSTTSQGATHNVCSQTIGIKPLGYRTDNSTKVFHLTAEPLEHTLADGKPTHHQVMRTMNTLLGVHEGNPSKKIHAWGYNGSTPGPTIEVNQGDDVRIILHNHLKEPTSLQLHGFTTTQDTHEDAQPGGAATYTFTADTAGTFMYHPGHSIAKQTRYGLMGMIVVHPPSYPEPIDTHLVLMLQEWALDNQLQVPNTVSHRYNWFTINGKASPSIPVIELTKGARVRLHVGSLMDNEHPLRLQGHRFMLVGTEGGLIAPSAQLPLATLCVPRYCTRTVEFVADQEGLWPLYAISRHMSPQYGHDIPHEVKAHGGMCTLVKVRAIQQR